MTNTFYPQMKDTFLSSHTVYWHWVYHARQCLQDKQQEMGRTRQATDRSVHKARGDGQRSAAKTCGFWAPVRSAHAHTHTHTHTNCLQVTVTVDTALKTNTKRVKSTNLYLKINHCLFFLLFVKVQKDLNYVQVTFQSIVLYYFLKISCT